MSAASPSTNRRLQHVSVSILSLALGCFVFPSAAFADDRPQSITYSTAPGAIPQLNLVMLQQPIKRVRILNGGLSPSRVTLEAGERVVWESFAGPATSIVFEREIAASMICHGLVNFYLEEDELRSAEIHTGESASFCELKPGQYRYKAIRVNPDHGAPAGAARRIEGWIVVKPKPEQGA